MHKSRLQELVAEISAELEEQELSASATEQTKQLSQDVYDYLASPIMPTNRTQTLLEQAQRLEIEYEQEHPRIRGIVREIVDLLSKMGI